MYSLSFFKNFGSDTFYEIQEEPINNLLKIAKKMNIATKLTENTTLIYKFRKISFTQKSNTRVMTESEKNEIEIKSLMNKITDDSYEEISKTIITLMEPSAFSSIFEISYKNKFFSNIYSKLTIKLCQNTEYKNFVLKKFENITSLFDNIIYIEDEYANNKNLDDREAISCFYTNLYIHGLIDKFCFETFAYYIISKIESFMDSENKNRHVEELLNMLYLLLSLSSIKIELTIIEKISISSNKTFKSVGNKSIFKCMDIMELK
jgi:hypothetical protein